jgi:O-antigen ligase
LVKGELEWAAEGNSSRQEKIWLVSLMVLPYATYLGLVMMLGLLIAALMQRGGQIWQFCGQRGLGWLTLGMLLSASLGLNKGESFLQLTNFLPFFLFFGVLATLPSVAAQPYAKLGAVAQWLLLSALPMSLLAVVEYLLKFQSVAERIQMMPLPSWLLTRLYEPDFGHRARSVFSHPNTLSAYLVILLGLGLGVVLKGLSDRTLSQPRQWTQAGALALCMAAIFCTGSRNGVLIALVLVAIALYAARRHRWVMFLGLLGSGAITSAVLFLGIGGRSLSAELITQDPRLGVWRLALAMIQQRPWLGWGFAGLRELYEPGSIPGYDSIAHAHNVWLFLASEAGVPVMVGFCLVVGTLYYGGIRAFITFGKRETDGWAWQKSGDRAILLGYLLAFTSCLLFGLFDVPLFDSRINVLSWGLLAAIYMLTAKKA